MMMWRVRKTACALVLVVIAIISLGSRAATLDQGHEQAAHDDKVTTLNPATFHQTVLQDSRVHVVEFFSGEGASSRRFDVQQLLFIVIAACRYVPCLSVARPAHPSSPSGATSLKSSAILIWRLCRLSFYPGPGFPSSVNSLLRWRRRHLPRVPVTCADPLLSP